MCEGVCYQSCDRRRVLDRWRRHSQREGTQSLEGEGERESTSHSPVSPPHWHPSHHTPHQLPLVSGVGVPAVSCDSDT